MNDKRIRIIFALLLGFLLASFGVFIYSDFQYKGKHLVSYVFALFTQGTFRDVSNGLYELVGSALQVNLFAEFSPDALSQQSFGALLFGEVVFPVILTWLSVGFVVGCMMKGLKYSYIINGILLAIILVLWLIAGIFAGDDIASIFSLATASKILTSMIFLSLGALFGGLIGGPNYF